MRLAALFISVVLCSCGTTDKVAHQSPPAPRSILEPNATLGALTASGNLPTDYKASTAPWILLPDLAPYFNGQFLANFPASPQTHDKLISHPDSYLQAYDFSGVAINDSRTCTAISPRHVVMATHWERSVGDEIEFRGSDGVIYSRTLEGKIAGTGDATMGILDSPLPSAVAHYRIFPAGYNWTSILGGSLCLALDQEGKALPYVITATGYSRSFDESRDDWSEYYGMLIGYPQHVGARVLHENLVNGDSGGPVFLIYEGGLVLVRTHQTTVSGPFYLQTAWMLNTANELTNRFSDQSSGLSVPSEAPEYMLPANWPVTENLTVQENL